MTTVLSFFTTWLLVILALLVLSRTAVGAALVYYALWLLVVLLTVAYASEIASLVSPQALTLTQ